MFLQYLCVWNILCSGRWMLFALGWTVFQLDRILHYLQVHWFYFILMTKIFKCYWWSFAADSCSFCSGQIYINSVAEEIDHQKWAQKILSHLYILENPRHVFTDIPSYIFVAVIVAGLCAVPYLFWIIQWIFSGRVVYFAVDSHNYKGYFNDFFNTLLYTLPVILWLCAGFLILLYWY